MRNCVWLMTFSKQWGATVSCNVVMLIFSGVSGQHFEKDLFVQNNETVITWGLPGEAETVLTVLGSSESLESTFQYDKCERANEIVLYGVWQIWDAMFSLIFSWCATVAVMQPHCNTYKICLCMLFMLPNVFWGCIISSRIIFSLMKCDSLRSVTSFD